MSNEKTPFQIVMAELIAEARAKGLLLAADAIENGFQEERQAQKPPIIDEFRSVLAPDSVRHSPVQFRGERLPAFRTFIATPSDQKPLTPEELEEVKRIMQSVDSSDQDRHDAIFIDKPTNADQ